MSRMNTTKKAVKPSRAPVMLHVSRRFGQRTCRSSYQAPLKYPRIPLNILASNPSGFMRVGFFWAGKCPWSAAGRAFFVGFDVSRALMRVTAGCSAESFSLAATVFSQLKSLLLQTVKYYYSALPSLGQAW